MIAFLCVVLGGATATAHAAATATVTTITASSTTPAQGAAVLLTVTVTAGGAPVPVGQVAICFDATFDCTASEAFAVLQLSANGTASEYLYDVGTAYLQAAYAGTSSYAASRSSSGGFTVSFTNTNIATVTTLAYSGTPGAYSLTPTVTTYSYPTGNVGYLSAPVSLVDTSNANTVLGTTTYYSSTQNSSFIPGVSPAAGTLPGNVASGDFNNDGRPDVAVVNTGDNTVSILLSNGDGTFQPQVTYPTGTTPGPIAVGDFNADDKLDLAIVNNTDKTIGILLGKGDGTFYPQLTYATGNNPNALAIGDINRDGFSDIVVLNHDDLTVGVLLNNGSGAFAAQVTYATGNDPRSVAIGDIALGTTASPDGIPDVAVANFADNTLSILYGVGDGTLQPQTTMATGNGPIAVSLQDFADGGYSSIAYLNYTDNTLTVIPRQFDGTNYAPANYGTGVGPTALISGFFTSEVEPVPAVLNSDGTVSIFPSTENFDGTYGPTGAIYSAPAGAVSLASGDFNSDGLPDLFFGGSSTSAISVLLQQTSYSTTYTTLSGVQVPGSSTSNVVATYPGETGYQASTSAPVTLTDSLITTTTALVLSPSFGVTPGQTDTLTATLSPPGEGNYSPTAGMTFMDNGTAVCSNVAISGGVATCTTGPLPIAQHVFSAVFPGDSYFAASTSPTHNLNVSNVSSTTLSLSASSVSVGTPVIASVSVHDINGQVTGGVVSFCESTATHCTGNALLGTTLLQNSTGTAPGTATLALHLSAGTHSVQAVFFGTVPDASSTSTAHTVTVTQSAATTTTLASSGSVGAYTLTATVTSLSGNATASGTTVTYTDTSNSFFGKSATLGAPAFTNSFATPVGYAVNSAGIVKDIHLVSLRNNGVLDMVYPNYDNGTLGVRLGNAGSNGSGNGTFGSKAQYTLVSDTSFNCPNGVALADVNGDGKLDAVLGDECSGMAYVFLGNGDGTFPALPNYTYDIDSTVTSSFQAIGPNSVTTGDFNQDGYPDIAVGTSEGTIYILLNKGTGDGSFRPAVLYPGYLNDDFFTNVTAVDLTGDGVLDLVYTQAFGGSVSVMLGNGDGTFQYEIQNDNTNSSTFEGNSLTIADYNGDGIPDAVVSDGAEIYTMLGNGDGTFQDGIVYSTGSFFAFASVLADFNGDGVLDVVVTSGANSGAIGIFTGKSNGTFNTFKKLNSFGVEDLAIASGDINGDGVPDVVVVSSDSSINYALIGNAGFSATAKVTGVSIPGSATAGAHSIVAHFPGDSSHTASASAGLSTLTGTPIVTTTTVGISPSSGSTYGTSTTVTATVTPSISSAYVSTANVTFKDGTTSLSPVEALSNGTASYGYTPAAGSHSFTAVYAGDANFKTSTSTALADTIVKATPVISWTPSLSKIYTGNAIGASVLNASSTTAGAFTYTATKTGGSPVTVTEATVLAVGTYTLTSTLTPTITANYTTQTSTEPFTVEDMNIFVANGNGTVSSLYNTGTPQSSATAGGAVGVAVDAFGNVWTLNAGSNSVAEFSSAGAVVNSGFTGSGLSSPTSLAIDGAGQVWITNSNNSISVFNSSGTPVSTTAYTGGSLSSPSSIAIDISGNLWIANSGSNSVTEVLGAAAPTTPIANGVASDTPATKP